MAGGCNGMRGFDKTSAEFLGLEPSQLALY